MYILEEESIFPGANENSLIERMFMHADNSRLLKRVPKSRLQFTLGHSFDEFNVNYSVDGWLKRVRPTFASTTVPKVLQDSFRYVI